MNLYLSPDHTQNSLCGVHIPQSFLSLSVSITLFFHSETASSKTDLLICSLIKCNFIPHAFFTENILKVYFATVYKNIFSINYIKKLESSGFFFFFKLEYNSFKMLCQFLLYNEANYCIDLYYLLDLLPPHPYPSYLGHHRPLS